MKTNLKQKQPHASCSKLSRQHNNKKQSGLFLNISEMHSIIEEHWELGQKLAWKLLRTWRVRLAEDDVVSIVGFALCEAAYRYNPEREASFKTFLFYHLRGALIKEISRIVQNQKFYTSMSQELLDMPEGFETSGNVHRISLAVDFDTPELLLQKKELTEFCQEANAFLDGLQQEVILRYFFYDESLTTIAEKLGYCRCHISRVKSRAVAVLKHLISLSCPLEASRAKLDSRIMDKLSPSALKQAFASDQSRYTGGRGRRKKITKQKYIVSTAQKAAA